MGDWLVEMSSDLVASLLAIAVAYFAAQRFVDRRVASRVQVYVQRSARRRGAAGAADVIPGDGEHYRLHVHNASPEMIYEPRWIGTPGGDPEARQQLEPILDEDG